MGPEHPIWTAAGLSELDPAPAQIGGSARLLRANINHAA
jgi:hypothetical protein